MRFSWVRTIARAITGSKPSGVCAVSRDDLALGPKIQVEVGQTVSYRGGSTGRVLVLNAKSPQGTESTYPIYTQDEKGAVFSHRVDGTLGIPGGSPFDIAMKPEELHIHVRAYRDQNGTMRVVAGMNEWPPTPFVCIGETTCVIKLEAPLPPR
jgi:hypothetical protein